MLIVVVRSVEREKKLIVIEIESNMVEKKKTGNLMSVLIVKF